MKLRILFYILTLIIFASCSERVGLSSTDNNKLLVECVLTQGKEITARVSTVSDFANINAITYPENARVYLLNDKNDSQLELRFDETRDLYYIPEERHTPNVSWNYELRAYLKDDVDNEIIGKTSFIGSNTIEKLPNKPSNIVFDETKKSFKIEGDFKLRNANKNPYYRLNAYYKSISGDGSLSELKALQFDGNSTDALAFFTNDFTDGVYVDINRVDYEDFNMSFSYPTEVKDLGNVSEHIYLVTEAISEPVYRYEVSKSKQLSAINSGSSDPVISFSNLHNGYGVFGSSTPFLDSIQVR